MYERGLGVGAYDGLGLDILDVRTWPGFQQAYDYLKSKLEEFFTLPARIGALKRRAATLLSVAQQKGAATAAAEVQAVIEGIPEIEAKHRDTSEKVSQAMSATKEAGLAAIPFLAIGAILVAAAGVKWLLDRVKRDEHTLDMIEQGIMTPEEAAGLRGGGLLPTVTTVGKGLLTLPWLGLIAAGGLMLWRRRR